MDKTAWISLVIILNSKNGKARCLGQKSWSHPALLLSSLTPHPILSQILCMLPSKYIQNPTTSHHFPNYPGDPSHHYLLPSFLLINLFYLFIYLWLCQPARSQEDLSLVAASGGYSSLWCADFSLRWLLLLRSTGSRCTGFSSCGTQASSCGSWALERRLSSCGTRAQLLCSMWDLPGPGLEPMCPALAGTFLTTAPPGKST